MPYTQQARRIAADPRFVALQRKRNGFAWTLTAIMVAIYFGYVCLAALAPEVMAERVTESITLGFPLGLGVILTAIVLTGVYVRRANGAFDRLTAELARETEGVELTMPVVGPGAATGVAR